MAYLEEFKKRIANRDFTKFLQLWEEYCISDSVEAEEFIEILEMVKRSDFANSFGKFAEMGLPLWETIKDPDDSHKVLKLITDIQTTNSPIIKETVLAQLEKKHKKHPQYEAFMKCLGLRNRPQFQNSLSNFDLLAHFIKGNCVFHVGGWGTGEIMDVSFLREQIMVEFENVSGQKPISFANAFKTLIPLDSNCFRARRFINPDELEQEARKDPVVVVTLLLEDLGPKTAAEIKDEMCVLIIPENDWVKWWQGARAKIKKSTLISTPAHLKDPFSLRHQELTHEQQLQQVIQGNKSIKEVLLMTYNFVRDLPNLLKKQELREAVKTKICSILNDPKATESEKLQAPIFMEYLFNQEIPGHLLKDEIKNLSNIEDVVNGIEIIAFKKRALIAIKSVREDWIDLFLSFLHTMNNTALRDYLLKELSEPAVVSRLADFLKKLKAHPEKHPETFIWYFQKIVKPTKESYPFMDKEGQCKFLESALILLHKIESDSEQRDLIKKIYTFLTEKRYAIIRQIIEGSSEEFIKEFLLLSSKTHIFTDHDKKILQSLAEVVHPSLGNGKKEDAFDSDPNIVWTTEEGYRRVHERIKQISSVEMIETAREIEIARAHGDLRENSEYKFAMEKRSRLQSEIRTLSNQIHRARIITENDFDPNKVGICSVVKIEDPKGQLQTYTILGTWDADTEKNILSPQSRLAQAMLGCEKNQEFEFNNETFKVVDFKSYFAKE